MLPQVIEFCLQVLGKEFKESMPKLKAAIGKLGRDEIVQYQTQGSLLVEGCLLKEGALKVHTPPPPHTRT